MAAEDSAVVVDFINDDITEILEELDPKRMMRQNAGVEHVRIGDDDMSGGADRLARGHGGVAIKGVAADIEIDLRAEQGNEGVQLRHLILGKGFGRKEIESSGFAGFEHCIQNRDVVAEGLAGSGGRYHHGVVAVEKMTDGLGLVAVESADAVLMQSRDQARIQ